jgi:hypothetical protein
VYFAAYGARTPLLALLGLKRLRNLVLVIAPYAVGVPLAFALAERLDSATAAGLVSLAVAPGTLLAPALVGAAGGRRTDMAGALLLGTVIVSFALVVTRPGTSALALTAVQALTIASLIGGTMPAVHNRLVPLQWASLLAALAVISFAVGTGPRIDALGTLVAFAALTLTLGVAGVVALALRRDMLSALAAVGTRDPIVAVALAWSTGGSDATGLPLASAVILGIVAAALVIRRR